MSPKTAHNVSGDIMLLVIISALKKNASQDNVPEGMVSLAFHCGGKPGVSAGDRSIKIR